MGEPLVAAEDLTKVYRLYPRPHDRLLELLGRRRHRAFEALKGVSFELGRGESLGVIGENGAGKSTLLKILSGVTAPTSGRLEVRGSVASLLELGTGFHPEFTGLQNIRLNAAILGLTEAALQEKLPEIVAFSELEDFIDRPVKTYSTGMSMRLGFAIAVQVDPDILIIDEALSVGDGYFQKKCMDRIRQFLESGRTLLFCSHAMYYVASFCKRALWLRHGRVAAYGSSEQVIREYEQFLLRKRPRGGPAEEGTPDPQRPSPAGITRVETSPGGSSHHREPWSVDVEWRAEDPTLAFHVAIGVDRIDGVQVCSFGTHRDGLEPVTGARHYRARLVLPELPLLKGQFDVYVFLLDEKGLHVYDRRVIEAGLEVVAPELRIGLIEAEHLWEVDRPAGAAASPVLAAS